MDFAVKGGKGVSLCIYSSWGDYEHGYYMAVGGRSSLIMSILNQL